MKTYIGVKIVQAEPMMLGAYNEKRGWTLPTGENPLRAGYFLTYPDGYVSWSPAEIFEGAYRLVSDDERSLINAVPHGDFRTRLNTEYRELCARFDKLHQFIAHSAGFQLLPGDDRELLKQQREHMSEYLQVLAQRVERSKADAPDEFPVVGEVKITGGDHSEEPVPFS